MVGLFRQAHLSVHPAPALLAAVAELPVLLPDDRSDTRLWEYRDFADHGAGLDCHLYGFPSGDMVVGSHERSQSAHHLADARECGWMRDLHRDHEHRCQVLRHVSVRISVHFPLTGLTV